MNQNSPYKHDLLSLYLINPTTLTGIVIVRHGWRSIRTKGFGPKETQVALGVSRGVTTKVVEVKLASVRGTPLILSLVYTLYPLFSLFTLIYHLFILYTLFEPILGSIILDYLFW